ncbi:GtrA family protein [Brackiella oedipodis]|uniref:GtrA family protein n=1 Tax=Brackiella oedipodis TaxID=124225 RepID=UPI001FDF3028|nr:GtrA family protein [Brackiella oedipodis]
MRIDRKFIKYAAVGILNTLSHWLVFAVLTWVFHLSQACANLWAFLVAVSLSFVLNARFTFKAQLSMARYLAFTLFMGGLSYVTGWLADRWQLAPILTLVIFSALSLVLGYLYSNYLVFKERDEQ